MHSPAAADGGARQGAAEPVTAEKVNASYLSRVLRLTLLAPNMVEAILDGGQAAEMTRAALKEPFPVEWAEQQRTFAPGA